MQDIFLTGIVSDSMKLVFDCFVIYSSDMFAYHLCKPPSEAHPTAILRSRFYIKKGPVMLDKSEKIMSRNREAASA